MRAAPGFGAYLATVQERDVDEPDTVKTNGEVVITDEFDGAPEPGDDTPLPDPQEDP